MPSCPCSCNPVPGCHLATTDRPGYRAKSCHKTQSNSVAVTSTVSLCLSCRADLDAQPDSRYQGVAWVDDQGISPCKNLSVCICTSTDMCSIHPRLELSTQGLNWQTWLIKRSRNRSCIACSQQSRYKLSTLMKISLSGINFTGAQQASSIL